MHTAEIEERTLRFHQRHAFLAKYNPRLRLDLTWESVSVVGAILRPFQQLEKLEDESLELVRDACCYVSFVALKIWDRSGIHTLAEVGAEGVRLKVGGLETIEPSQIELEKALLEVLASSASARSFVRGELRPVDKEDDLASLFFLGVLTGTSTYYQGGLADTKSSELLDLSVEGLAKLQAERHAEIFPDEKIGQVAETYLDSLIYPPLFFGELFPGLNAALSLSSFLDGYGFSPQLREGFLSKLEASPDPTFSLAASLVSISCLQGDFSSEDIRRASASLRFLRLSRVSLCKLRGEEDWLDSPGSELDAHFYEIERAFGLFYWSQLSVEFVMSRDSESSQLIKLVAAGNLELALELLEKLLKETPESPDLLAQKAYLLEQILREKDLEDFLDVSGHLEIPRLAHRQALLFDRQGDTLRAVQTLKPLILNPKERDRYFLAEFAIDYQWLLIKAGLFDEAKAISDAGGDSFYFPLPSMLNNLEIAWRLGDHDEIKRILRKLAAYHPLHPRVFPMLKEFPL